MSRGLGDVYKRQPLPNHQPKKRPGRKRPADAELLISQVKVEFKKRIDKPGGAKRAATELGVCVASFYNYVRGKSLPDFEVLRTAHEKWGIKWKYIDTSEVLRVRNVRSPKQYVFSFLDALREEDVKVVEIGPRGESVLQVVLKIRFPA